MFLARYFPGLQLRLEDIDQMTPEATDQLRKAGEKFLKWEFEERVGYVKVLARAASAGAVRLG